MQQKLACGNLWIVINLVIDAKVTMTPENANADVNYELRPLEPIEMA